MKDTTVGNGFFFFFQIFELGNISENFDQKK